MKIDREPDEVIEHRPIQCEGCPHAGVCKLRCCETRYEYEAIVETKLIAHKVLGCKVCALTGEAVQGIFPLHITEAKQHVARVAGLAVSLLTIGYMNVDRVQKLLKSLRIPVSSGTIQDMLVKAARLVKAPVERIRQTITQLPVAHYNETGWRVARKLHDILRFARDWRVSYTNNTAERVIRCAKVKEKVPGCFRTKSGADVFARVLSFISSAVLHGISSFDAIVAAFRGYAVGILFRGGLNSYNH